jgi:hypothetical protein
MYIFGGLMKMNALLISSIVLFSWLFLTSSVYAQKATENLRVVLMKQNPYPAEPGQTVDVEISLENKGYGDAQNVVLEIVPKNPFTLLPGEEKIKTFSRIASMDHITARYKLYVDMDTISNSYELEFRLYQIGDMTTQKIGKVLIQVQGKPKLVIDKIETDPYDIEPGDTVIIKIGIKNVGTGSASLMEASLFSNTTYILPVLSGSVSYIGTVKPNQIGEATFYMSVDKTSEYKTYPSLLTINYKDEGGNQRTDSFYIGIPVKGRPVIEILSAKVENSDFKVDVENIGTANAKALKITLLQNGKIIDSAVANELRPSKYKTVRFKGFEYGQATINISYLDEDNKFFSNEYEISIKPSAYSETEKENNLSMLLPIFLLIIIAETYYIWRLRRHIKK